MEIIMYAKYSICCAALLSAALIYSVPAMAESSWSWQHPYPTGAHIYGIQFINNNNGWIVTVMGAVFRTDDGGISWEELYRIPGATKLLSGIFFKTVSEGWASGEDGILLHTIDGGLSWATSNPSSNTLVSIEFIDDNYGSIVGHGGTILRTMNGGDSWQTQGSGITSPIYDVSFADPTTGWATGSAGYLLHTETAGAFWEEQYTGVSVFYTGIHFIDESYGLAAGGDCITHTYDGGDSWSVAYQVGGEGFCGIDFAGNLGTASGMLGAAVTENEGGTWEYESMPEHPLWSLEPELLCVTVPSDSRAVTAGNFGIIYSRDLAGDWSQLSSHETLKTLNDITHLEENHVWACGNSGLIMASSDGGVNWESQLIDDEYTLRCINFPSALIGYCVGSSPSGGVILRTTDGGSIWTEITPVVPDVEVLLSVDFMNEDCGVAVGNAGKIVYTTDGGASWTEKTGFGSIGFSSVCFGDTDRGWIVGGSGKIICFDFSSDSWSEQTSPMTNDFHGLFALNADTVWAVGWNGTIVRTLDANNWQTVAVTGKDYQDVWFDSNGLDGYFTGLQFGETSDGGYTVTHSTNGLETLVRWISFIDINHGWGCGYFARILCFEESSTGISEFGHSVPSIPGTGIISSPNPFTTCSTVSFTLPAECHITLDLYDLTGRKVQNLHTGNLAGGEQSFILNGADLPPGMYYLRLNAGGITETRSLIRIP